MTPITQEYAALPQEVQASLRADRIDLYQAGIIQHVIAKYGIERGLNVLKRIEKLNSISAYFENITHGFKIHEFTFNYQSTTPEERQRIVVALKEALDLLEYYAIMEVSQ